MKDKKKVKLTIGIVGPICAGKETLGAYLKRRYKATYYSLSDIIRDELDFLGFDRHSRELLQAIGNELRYHRGSDYLARRIVDKMKAKDHGFTVIGSIRNPDEVYFLRDNLTNFYLLAIDVDQKIRYKRLKKRGRLGDSKSWEEFLKAEEREFNQKTKEFFQIQVDTASSEADFFIANNRGKELLYKNTDRLLSRIISPTVNDRLGEIIIAVGSRNPTKITAVRSVIDRIFPNAKVVAVEVESKVSATPLSDEESIKGATNRAKEALRKLNGRLAVGLEGGLRKIGSKYFLTNWAVVVDSKGKVGVGAGSEVLVPDTLVTKIKNGQDLGKIADGLMGSKDIKAQIGTSGVLTKGLVHRSHVTEIAVSSALAIFLSPELYGRKKRRKSDIL